MTKQETFKRRIRSRMTTTGERYAEARRVLIEQSARSKSDRKWAAQPEMSDSAIRSGTGRDWDEWCDLLDKHTKQSDDHTSIARIVREEFGIDDWWAQGVTVGYERITGLRLPHQMADGTFTANKSRTVGIDSTDLRNLLLDQKSRLDLFPAIDTELKSNPTAKAIRLLIGPGTATIRLDQLEDGRTKVAIAHEKLPTFEDVEEWKFYWSDWLGAIVSSSS